MCLDRKLDDPARVPLRNELTESAGLSGRIGWFNAPWIATNLIPGVWQVGSCCNAFRGWTMH